MSQYLFIVFLQGHIGDQPDTISTEEERKKKPSTAGNRRKHSPGAKVVSEKATFRTRV
jgi:hypothetical protein